MAEESVESREERAKNSTSPAELEKLAEDEDYYVRSAVAENTNTLGLMLDKLGEYEEFLVRSSVAGNPNTPVLLLEKLVEDKDEYVRRHLAGNENTPVSVLEKLAQDKDVFVRSAVALNVKTSASILEKLAVDNDSGVRRRASSNVNSTSLIIDKKVAEEDEVVLKRETGKMLIKEIIVYYTGSQTDYENTIYYPNGLIDDEEGVEAILVLFDKGGWSINFSKEGFEYNLTNVLNILQKNTFKAVASNEIELEDTTGYSGELHLNGEIVSSEGDGGLLIKNATEIIDNDWEKIGEREPYECVVESTSSPEVKIIFENGSDKMFEDVNQAIEFIEQNI